MRCQPRMPTNSSFCKSDLGPIQDGDIKMWHLKIPSSAPFSLAGAAPVTECLSFYFPSDHSEAAYTESFEKFKEEAGKCRVSLLSSQPNI
jgi:hypothetical protein